MNKYILIYLSLLFKLILEKETRRLVSETEGWEKIIKGDRTWSKTWSIVFKSLFKPEVLYSNHYL